MICRTLSAFWLVSAVAHTAHADVARGGELARMWCANCHVVASNPAGPVPQGPPSFHSIALSGLSAEQLRAFLAQPHGAMPNLSLTRAEIDDLIGYIESLR